MSNMNCSLKLDKIQSILARRGIEPQGKVQFFVDSEVVRYSDPYVPFDTGMLKNTAPAASRYGTGEVIYNTPYAAKQYYTNGGKGLRGKLWFERMKADHKDDILNGAAKIAGGEAKK